jgi:LPS sulfotransferase NodH
VGEVDAIRATYLDPCDIVRPALGSKPWAKCCGVCAFRGDDPQQLGEEALAMLREDVADDQVDFYCVHRTTSAGNHRVCAAAAAIRSARP